MPFALLVPAHYNCPPTPAQPSGPAARSLFPPHPSPITTHNHHCLSLTTHHLLLTFNHVIHLALYRGLLSLHTATAAAAAATTTAATTTTTAAARLASDFHVLACLPACACLLLAASCTAFFAHAPHRTAQPHHITVNFITSSPPPRSGTCLLKMDALSGKNSTGRRVSLLNDGPAPPPQLVRLPSITPSLQSRTSAYSSPAASPPTPRLVRSDSSDSNMQTPSPITPDFAFEQGMDSPVFSQNGFFPSQKDLSYPMHQPQTAPMPYPPQPGYFNNRPDHLQDPHHQQHQQQLSEPSALNARPKKNSYPCPMAKQFGCNDYFTTSGHAARHAKKHTGKKDAFCPECNKAFTRKDNMEQHRRTHQTGRNAAKGADRDIKKAKHQAKRPRPAPLQSTMPSLSSLSMVDPTLPVSPATASYMAPPVQSSDSFLDFPNSQHRSPYPDPTPYSYNPSSYGGLDALAIAASGEKRKFES